MTYAQTMPVNLRPREVVRVGGTPHTLVRAESEARWLARDPEGRIVRVRVGQIERCSP